MAKFRTAQTEISRWPPGVALDAASTAAVHDGHCVVVTAGTVFVWRVGDSQQQQVYRYAVGDECSAELCAVLPPSSSLLCVSRRGEALCWARPGDAHCDKALLPLEPHEHATSAAATAGGALVGTDLGGLLHVSVSAGGALRATRLSQSDAGGGMLSGLGRLLWRRPDRPQPVRRIAAAAAGSAPARDVFVLRSESLQRWRASHDDVKLASETALLETVRQGQQADERLPLDVFLLDLAVARSRAALYVLAASVASQAPVGKRRLLSYHLVEVSSNDLTVVQISTLKHQAEYQEDDPTEQLSARLLLADPEAYVVWRSALLSTRTPEDSRPLDLLDLTSRDAIIGCGLLRNRAALVSLQAGVWSVHQPDIAAKAMLQSSDRIPPGDTLAQAFSAFVRGHVVENEELVLPFGALSAAELSRIVVDFSRAVLDKRPTQDARWAEQSHGDGYSLQTQHQLEAKTRTFMHFADFLNHAHVAPEGSTLLESLSDEGKQLVELHHQKLQAAVRLSQLQASFLESARGPDAHVPETLLVDAVRSCVENVRGYTEWHWAVTATDAFYSEVSRVEELLLPLGQLVRESTQSTLFSQLSACSRAMLCIVEGRNVGMLCTPYAVSAASDERVAPVTVLEEHLRWAFTALTEFRPPPSTDSERLYETLLHLSDVVLYVFSLAEPAQEASAVESSMFAVFRSLAVDFFRSAGRDLFALELADRHHDFAALAELSLQRGELEAKYIALYPYEFPRHLFARYLTNGLSAELLGNIGERYPRELDEFLAEVPQFRWIHNFRVQDPPDEQVYFDEAQQLVRLGLGENSSLSRRKTLLSLARLAARCAPSRSDAAAFDDFVARRLVAVRIQQRAGVDAAPPDDDRALFDKLLAPPSSPERIMYAISLAARCFPAAEVEAGLIQGWKALLGHTAWDGVARELELERPGFRLDETLQQTPFYRHAVEGAAKGYLNTYILQASIAAVSEKLDQKSQRVLETLFQTLKREMSQLKMKI